MRNVSSCPFHCYSYRCLLASDIFNIRAEIKTYSLYLPCMWEWAQDLLVFILQKILHRYSLHSPRVCTSIFHTPWPLQSTLCCPLLHFLLLSVLSGTTEFSHKRIPGSLRHWVSAKFKQPVGAELCPKIQLLLLLDRFVSSKRSLQPLTEHNELTWKWCCFTQISLAIWSSSGKKKSLLASLLGNIEHARTACNKVCCSQHQQDGGIIKSWTKMSRIWNSLNNR